MLRRIINSYITEEEKAEYEALIKKTPQEMDKRCILGLHSFPEDICYAAVRRLHAIKSAGRPLTEEEERGLPGCPWAVQHQKSNYCFFKYLSDYAAETPPSDQEIAHMLRCSINDVKAAEKNGTEKFKSSDMINQFMESFDSCEIVEGRESDVSYSIIK